MSIASDLATLNKQKNNKKILTLDIETGPNVASVWRLFDENIGINQLHEAGEVISVAAKWENSSEVLFWSQYHHGHKNMIIAIHSLLSEADVVQHWNGKRFDIPWLNSMFLKYDLLPPRPFKQYCLMQAVKARFKFASYKLDFVSRALGVGRKIDTGGYELWHKCLFGTETEKKDAWELMRVYNMADVTIAENVKHRLMGWLYDYPVLGTVKDSNESTCFICSSPSLREDGTYTTGTTIYQQYQCNKCGTWQRGLKSIGRSSTTKGIK